ncbi:MAG: hypothetical protein HYW15_00740 [Candidatus Giovannonibacteria bacterium]|nr:MAG: hypothetical protein HYW15_00740 [Candidatus Giovannonibacteria bacterium]
MDSNEGVVTVELLTNEEWEFVKRLEVPIRYVNGASALASAAGLISFILGMLGAHYYFRDVVDVKSFQQGLFYVFGPGVAAGLVVGFLSYLFYFRKRAKIKMKEVAALSRDSRFTAVLQKLGKFEKVADDIRKTKDLAHALNPQDALNSKLLRRFLDSIAT